MNSCIGLISDKPNRPNGPIEVVDVRAEKATVKWKKPDDWQGSDITGYTLEKMDQVGEPLELPFGIFRRRDSPISLLCKGPIRDRVVDR